MRGTVYARAKAQEAGYGLETELAEPDGAAGRARRAAARSARKRCCSRWRRSRRRLEAVLEDAPDWLDAPGARAGRGRDPRACPGGARRWRRGSRCSARIGGAADPDFVDWLAVERVEGREFDVGLHRRWLDPTRPLAAAVLKPAHGVLVTSATLRGGEGLGAAEARTGALASRQRRRPFRGARARSITPASAEVLIVTDVKRGDIAALAGAYARLIEAAGGGTLGLFTAIQRLSGVHARIADRLARAGLPLLAQHVDPIDTGTLVDIFRDDPRASLLGTDALRDGVDVPGESLRLVVMERVPWPRPTVLHAARRMAGGGSAYDDRVVRARLAQAFGRLIRRDGDRGRVRDPVGGDALAAARRLSARRADPPRPARPGDRSSAGATRSEAGRAGSRHHFCRPGRDLVVISALQAARLGQASQPEASAVPNIFDDWPKAVGVGCATTPELPDKAHHRRDRQGLRVC